ncbi:hypothetical protein CBS101457_003831 [Exobasidium rhododendri]|nr:hypothetical protein CBS101457_003831 [Exobasidium rhododendri]
MQSINSDELAGPSSIKRAGVVILLVSIAVLTFTLQFFSVHVRRTRKNNRKARNKLFKRLGLEVKGAERRTVIGFFHPYCNAGGGGERVLWQAIEYHLRQDPNTVVVVYSGDVSESSSEEILAKCRARFGIPLDDAKYSSRIWILPLSNRSMVSDSYWSRVTLLGQSFGSMRLAFEACTQLLPDVWIDTMGYAFSYPVVRMFNNSLPIGGYVHYPTISNDMLQRVRNREAGHTNNSDVSKSKLKSKIKLVYYNLFASFYSWALRRSDVLVGNGSWTQNHLNRLVFGSKKIGKGTDPRFVHVVYPPCDTASMSSFPLTDRNISLIVSLAQFRPEKEHSTQLKIVAKLIEVRKRAGEGTDEIHLCCMGSCRNEEDEERIEGLKKLATDLGIEDHVSFVVNAPYSTILQKLSSSSIGLSTMVDEHFGINVVEFMAAGLITLSHASAGPLLDIAVPASGQITGFHAKTEEDFVEKMQLILKMGQKEELAIRKAARMRAIQVFSNEAFCQSWENHLWSRLAPANVSKKDQ